MSKRVRLTCAGLLAAAMAGAIGWSWQAGRAARTHPPQVTDFHLGQAATQQQMLAADISVAPNGAGLPPGQGTAEQGSAVYAARCAVCHGSHGEGGPHFPALAGGYGTLASGEPVLTVGSFWPYATTLWDYINRAMPYQQPGSLEPDQVYALTAYILYLNKIVGYRQELDAKTLPQIKMPNRKGFSMAHTPGKPRLP